MVSAYVIVATIVAVLAVAIAVAYTTGAADPIIEQIGIMFFKAKAEAEEKKLQAQGLKEGEDFLKSEFRCSFYTWASRGRVGICERSDANGMCV